MTGLQSCAAACVLGFFVTGGASLAESQERGGGGRGAGGPANPDVQLLLPLDGLGRGRGDQLAGPVVVGAPFSGDATTTVTQTLGDGTRIEQRTTTKLFRDSTGRTRREQTVIGLDRLKADPPQTTITFDTVPGDTMPYVLNPVTRTARRGGGVFWLNGNVALSSPGAALTAERAVIRYNDTLTTFNYRAPQSASVPSDTKPIEEQLGTRSFEGVKATGRRTTVIIPTDRIGNDKPIQITDEQWESPELRLTVYSRFSDPRTGVVEYRLTNVNRSEPRGDLFAVPPDYTIIENTPGLRTGRAGERGGGGRGGRGN